MAEQSVTVTVPYPEIEQQNADKSIRQQFEELQAREAREAEAALNQRLDSLNTSGDLSEVKRDLSLRVKFVNKFGWQRFAQLNSTYTQHQTKLAADAKREERMSKRTISTAEDRLKALHAKRKA